MAIPVNQGLPAVPLVNAPQLADAAASLLNFAASLLIPQAGAAVIWPGSEVSWDIPDDGLLYVRVAGRQAQGQGGCFTSDRSVLGLGCLRSVLTMLADGSAPPWTDRTADAFQMIDDSEALYGALQLLPKEYEVSGATWQPLGPSGGVGGGEWLVPVMLTA